MQCLAPDVLHTATVTSRKLRDLVSRGLFEDALRLYQDPVFHASFIIPSLLKASSSSSSPASLRFGLQVHSFLVKTARDMELVTANSLLAMYSRRRDGQSARLVFDRMPPLTRDAVTWNSIIMCYVRNENLPTSIHMLKSMLRSSDFTPRSQVIASVVSLCGRAGDLSLGMQIHARAISGGKSNSCSFLSTALIDMYSRCRDLQAASKILQEMMTMLHDDDSDNDDMEEEEKKRNDKVVPCWTAMITGCATNGNYSMSLGVFREMMQVEGMKPNRVTLLSVLPSCAELGALRHGKEIHAHVFRHGHVWGDSHLDAALIDMYCRCGLCSSSSTVKSAWIVFERVGEERRDVVMWSSMIGCLSRRGDAIKAMCLFHRMRMGGIRPNSVTLLAVVGACKGLSSVGCSHAIHCYAVKLGLDLEAFVGNALIDMYAKCGCLEASCRVFEEMPGARRDPVSWSALISGYGRHGRGSDALRFFDEMREMGVEPDGITLLAALSACNHAGLVDQALCLFHQYPTSTLSAEHYACLVDLLGRAGKLEDACEVANSMPMRLRWRLSMWGALVSACRAHGRFDIAESLAVQLIDSEPDNPTNYTLLSTIYAEMGNWIRTEDVRKLMREKGLKQRSGYSLIEMENVGLVTAVK